VEDRLDHHHDGNGARQMRDGQVDELRPWAGAVECCGLLLGLVLGLERGHEDEDRKGSPLPSDHHNNRIGGGLGGAERDGFELWPKREESTEHHVDPEDGVHGGHHEEGRDQEHPHDAPSGEIAVDQDGDCEAQYHGQNEDANDDEKAVLYSKPEVFVI